MQDKLCFERRLQSYLEEIFQMDPLLVSIQEAVRYAIEEGKRIRPILLLRSYCAYGAADRLESIEEEAVWYFAMALEMIHAYSLVHDDLPCMDDDQYRRGALTVHAKFGETIGVLCGDALLNLSMETILLGLQRATNASSALQAALVLYRHAGIQGMIGGQMRDLQPEKLTDLVSVEKMNRDKTCALIEAAVMCGAFLAGAETAQVKAAQEFGYHLGLAFQAQDDLFDVQEDEKEEKRTILSLLGQAKTEQYVTAHTMKALEQIETLPNASLLEEFAEALLHRTS